MLAFHRANNFFSLIAFVVLLFYISFSVFIILVFVFSSGTLFFSLFILNDTVARSFLLWWMHHDKVHIHKYGVLQLCKLLTETCTHKHEPWCINEATAIAKSSIHTHKGIEKKWGGWRAWKMGEEILLFCRAKCSQCQNTNKTIENISTKKLCNPFRSCVVCACETLRA